MQLKIILKALSQHFGYYIPFYKRDSQKLSINRSGNNALHSTEKSASNSISLNYPSEFCSIYVGKTNYVTANSF